jgi:hypothetical protein
VENEERAKEVAKKETGSTATMTRMRGGKRKEIDGEHHGKTDERRTIHASRAYIHTVP